MKIKTVNNVIAVRPFVVKQKERDTNPKPVSFGVMEPQELITTTAVMNGKDVNTGDTIYFRPDVLMQDFNKRIYLTSSGEKFILVPQEHIVAVGEES